MMSEKMKRCLVPAEFNPVAKLYRIGHMGAWNNKYLLRYLTIWQMRKKQMLLENKWRLQRTVRTRGPSVCMEKCRCVLCWPMTLQLLWSPRRELIFQASHTKSPVVWFPLSRLAILTGTYQSCFWLLRCDFFGKKSFVGACMYILLL